MTTFVAYALILSGLVSIFGGLIGYRNSHRHDEPVSAIAAVTDAVLVDALTPEDLEWFADNGWQHAIDERTKRTRHEAMWAAQQKAVEEKAELDAKGIEYDQIMSSGYLIGVRARPDYRDWFPHAGDWMRSGNLGRPREVKAAYRDTDGTVCVAWRDGKSERLNPAVLRDGPARPESLWHPGGIVSPFDAGRKYINDTYGRGNE